MNTYIFITKAKGKRKTMNVTVRAASLEQARVDFDSRRSADVRILQVVEV